MTDDELIISIKNERLDAKLTADYVNTLTRALNVKTAYKVMHKQSVIYMIINLHSIRYDDIKLTEKSIDVDKNEVLVRFTTVYSEIEKEFKFKLP